MLSFFTLLFHSCQSDVLSDQNVIEINEEEKQQLTEKEIEALLSDTKSVNDEASWAFYKEFKDDIDNALSKRNGDCGFNMESRVPDDVDCFTNVVTGSVTMWGCIVEYTATYDYCVNYGVQVTDITWNNTSTNCNGGFLLTKAKDVNTYTWLSLQNYYTIRNLIYSRIYRDITPGIIQFIDDNTDSDTWFIAMSNYVANPCYVYCGNEYEQCGINCCLRSTLFYKEGPNDPVVEWTDVAAQGQCTRVDGIEACEDCNDTKLEFCANLTQY